MQHIDRYQCGTAALNDGPHCHAARWLADHVVQRQRTRTKQWPRARCRRHDVEPVGTVVWPAGVAAISALSGFRTPAAAGYAAPAVDPGARRRNRSAGLTALVAAKFGARRRRDGRLGVPVPPVVAGGTRRANPRISWTQAVSALARETTEALVASDAAAVEPQPLTVRARARPYMVRPRGRVRHVLFDGAGQGDLCS